MKKIYLKPFNSKSFYDNNVFRMNNGNNIFWNLDKVLCREGINIETIDLDENDGDLYLYADVPYPWELRLWLKTLFLKNKILINFESPLVNPFSQIKLLHFLFRKIYTWNDQLIDKKKYQKFFIPQLSSGINTMTMEFGKKKLLILINSKKNAPFAFAMLTSYKKNLFKERVRAADYFSKEIPRDFEVYGKGWNKERYSTYRGEFNEDKLKLLRNFKFCICFENAQAPGYITEKIFDCFKAKCVPIYLGATNIEKYIPKNCFIDFRDFYDYSSLLKYIKSIDENAYRSYIISIELFLKKKNTREKWFEEGFKEILMSLL